MKKLLMLLILVVSFSTISAQKTYRTSTISTAYLNKKTNTWIWSKGNGNSIKITLDQDKVYIDNEAQSVLFLIGDMTTRRIKGDGTAYEWSAIDEEKIRCTFSIIGWGDGSPMQFYLTYRDIKAAYTIEAE